MKKIIGSIICIALLSGCAKVTEEIPVCTGTKPRTPAAIGSVVVLQGSYQDVYGVSDAGCTFKWTGPNGFVSYANPMELNFYNTTNYGTYTVVAMKGGCTSDPTTFVVTATPQGAPPCTVSIHNKLQCSTGNSFNTSGVATGTNTSCYYSSSLTDYQINTTSGYVIDLYTVDSVSSGSYYQLNTNCGVTRSEAYVRISDGYGTTYYESYGGNVYANVVSGQKYFTFCGATFVPYSGGSTFTVTGDFRYQ